MGPMTDAIVWGLSVLLYCAAYYWYRRARGESDVLVALRGDNEARYFAQLANLDEHREKLLQLKAAQEPFDQLERYASKLRDANEVHRHRERVLVAIADAAKVAVNGAFVQRDRLHPTAHVRLDQFDALKGALAAWGGTVIAVPGEVAREKTNNLSGPSDEGELPEAG